MTDRPIFHLALKFLLLAIIFVILFAVSEILNETLEQEKYLKKISEKKAPSNKNDLFVGYNNGELDLSVIPKIVDPTQIFIKQNNNNKLRSLDQGNEYFSEFQAINNQNINLNFNRKRTNSAKRNHKNERFFSKKSNHYDDDYESPSNDEQQSNTTNCLHKLDISDQIINNFVDLAIFYQFVDQINKNQNNVVKRNIENSCLFPNNTKDLNNCNYILKKFFQTELSFLHCSVDISTFTNNFDYFFNKSGQLYLNDINKIESNQECKRCTFFLAKIVSLWNESYYSLNPFNQTFPLQEIINFLNNSVSNTNDHVCYVRNYSRISNIQQFNVQGFSTTGNQPNSNNFCFSVLWQWIQKYGTFLFKGFQNLYCESKVSRNNNCENSCRSSKNNQCVPQCIKKQITECLHNPPPCTASEAQQDIVEQLKTKCNTAKLPI